MKRALTLLLALMLVVALFAGCGPSTTTPTNTPATTPGASTPAPGGNTPAPTEAPVMVENGHEAVWDDVKYNEYGIPTEMYDYTEVLPFNTDANMKPFTYWMTLTSNAQNIKAIEDYADNLAPKKLQELTGVVVEYRIVPSTSLETDFSTMLAGDDLTDIIRNAATYYPQSMYTGISEGYFVNVYDYLEYLPCYQYTINHLDQEVWDFCYANEGQMPWLTMTAVALYNTQGIGVRGDYLDKLNIKAEDVRTVEEFYNMLKALKTLDEVEWPCIFGRTGDMFFGNVSNAWETWGSCNLISTGAVQVYVVDGEVRFPYCTDELHDYIEEVSKWWKEGLINPNMSSFNGYGDILTEMTTGTAAATNASISFYAQYIRNNQNKDARFEPIPNLILEDGQIHHLKNTVASLLNGTLISFSAECENIPLLMKWADFWYSEEGHLITQFGEEGVTYTVDEDGQIWWTELCYANPDGLTMFQCWDYYATHGLGGRAVVSKGNFYPAGIKNIYYTEIWESIPNDKAYIYSSAVELTEEQENQFASMFSDLSTFIIENYIKFITGDKPLSEWDAYVAECKRLKLDECIQIYQDAYDNWEDTKPVRKWIPEDAIG